MLKEVNSQGINRKQSKRRSFPIKISIILEKYLFINIHIKL